MQPRCADYFADRDLAAVCTVDRIDPRCAGRDFTALTDSIAALPWFYTGGFENHPDWVARISRRHPLWAMDAESLRAVRNPARVANVLAGQHLPCPAVSRDCRGLPLDGTWLRKPLASGGGRGIEPLLTENTRRSAAHYFQERIDGPSFAALFMGWVRSARLIGVTRQLIGTHGSPFVYRGSVGPVRVTKPLATRLLALGDALTRAFGLTGWFGVDFILRDGIPWPVEINPRYTASVEIHELATGRSLLAQHRDACRPRSTAGVTASAAELTAERMIAKWILYAPQRLVAPEIVAGENEAIDLWGVRSIADIPWPETIIEPGEPVMTLMAEGTDLAECRSRMARLARTWTKRLGITGDDSIMNAFAPDRWSPGDDDALDV